MSEPEVESPVQTLLRAAALGVDEAWSATEDGISYASDLPARLRDLRVALGAMDHAPRPIDFSNARRGVHYERATKGMRVVHVTDAEDKAPTPPYSPMTPEEKT